MFSKIYFFILFLLLFSGCKRASSLLEESIRPKTHNYAQSNQLVKDCHFNQLFLLLKNNKNKLLKASEEGLLYYYQNKSKISNNYFDKAINIYRDNENKAFFDVSTILRQEYKGEGYDKVFLHNYKAINYLVLGQAESARVEARNSNIFQQEEYLKLQTLQKDNEGKDKNKYLLSRYDTLFQSVNQDYNPYQNPFAYYISALSYAENEDYGNALIDIKKAMKLFPNSKLLEEKRSTYRQQKKSKSIELFFDVGQSPLKSQVQLAMDIGNDEKEMLYLPTFSLSKSKIAYIEILDSKDYVLTRSTTLTDINAIKINEFKEKLPSMLSVISNALSSSVKSTALSEKSKLLAGIFKATTTIYAQNDIATWSLLPQKILVTSFQATNNPNYKIVTYTKEGNRLKEYPLFIKQSSVTNHTYRHFFLREEKMCYSN